MSTLSPTPAPEPSRTHPGSAVPLTGPFAHRIARIFVRVYQWVCVQTRALRPFKFGAGDGVTPQASHGHKARRLLMYACTAALILFLFHWQSRKAEAQQVRLLQSAQMAIEQQHWQIAIDRAKRVAVDMSQAGEAKVILLKAEREQALSQSVSQLEALLAEAQFAEVWLKYESLPSDSVAFRRARTILASASEKLAQGLRRDAQEALNRTDVALAEKLSLASRRIVPSQTDDPLLSGSPGNTVLVESSSWRPDPDIHQGPVRASQGKTKRAEKPSPPEDELPTHLLAQKLYRDGQLERALAILTDIQRPLSIDEVSTQRQLEVIQEGLSQLTLNASTTLDRTVWNQCLRAVEAAARIDAGSRSRFSQQLRQEMIAYSLALGDQERARGDEQGRRMALEIWQRAQRLNLTSPQLAQRLSQLDQENGEKWYRPVLLRWKAGGKLGLEDGDVGRLRHCLEESPDGFEYRGKCQQLLSLIAGDFPTNE